MICQDLNKINLPNTPGVYFWLGEKIDSSGISGREILYVGKATNLKQRVRSYFSDDLINTRGAHIVDMVFKTQDITFRETDSVLEALILEAELIKKYQPYYNKQEKDDKSFNCVVITKEDIPRVFLVREKDVDKKEKQVYVTKIRQTINYDSIYGPFPKGSAIREALKIIRKIFPYVDLLSTKKDRKEFYRQIRLVPDLDTSIDIENYQRNISSIKMIFSGKMKKLFTTLKKEMNTLAKAERFEDAEDIKKKLFALEHIQDVSLIKREVNHFGNEFFRIEAYDVAHTSGKNMVGAMVVIENSQSNKNEYRKFNIKGFDKANDAGALKEMLIRRFNHSEWRYPDMIVVDGNQIQINVASNILKENSLNIPIIAVTKDERHKPKSIIGDQKIIEKYKYEILLANSESHRFVLSEHRKRRDVVK